MNRKILLIEPNYKNKYPPMSLMKLATYYKNLGDEVTFFKGNLQHLVLTNTYETLVEQLNANDNTICWGKYKNKICQYIKRGTPSLLSDIPNIKDNPLILGLFEYYRSFYFHKDYFKPEFRKYDRVGITTLFTFYWDITIDTINFVKKLCKTNDGVLVGGVMASILADRVREATKVKVHVGTLSTPGELDSGDNQIIDTLPLDYSILDEIDYNYPASNAYYAYMTRGCVNHCPFCAVPKLEPEYKSYLPVSKQVEIASDKFGAKKDLLLLDNNVLASSCFDQIIEDIKKAGFSKDATYIEPNTYEVAVRNLKSGYNDKAYIRVCVREYQKLISKQKKSEFQVIYDELCDRNLLDEDTATQNNILETYELCKPWFEKMYHHRPKKRYVDFNQGIDSRLVNDYNMEKMSEIPVRPLRIAFDHWELRDKYENAIRTAVRHGHKELSNYILYNYKDKPLELYWRLKLNVELSDELDAHIYSFPMKYHPIEDPDYFSNRDYIGTNWNRKFIRTIQAVLNSTKGKVGMGRSFFDKAFGSNEGEFIKLLYMPESMIIYRLYFEKQGLTEKWWKEYQALNEDEIRTINPLIEKNDFNDIESLTKDHRLLNVLRYYTITHSKA